MLFMRKSGDEVNLANGMNDTLKIDLKDIMDLDRAELTVKGDKGDIVHLDKTQWTSNGKEGVYNSYTHSSNGTTAKLLLDENLDIRDI